MVCVDKSVKRFIANAGVENCQETKIVNGDAAQVTGIGYDLRTQYFCCGADAMTQELVLDPGEAVFVAAQEKVELSEKTMARVYIKNGRLRQGLSLEAPVYQPGHKTRVFFRLRNVSDSRIALKAGESYAMIVFEQLEEAPEKPYAGTFADEDIYKGLAGYSTVYKDQIESVGAKLDKMEKLEANTYANVSLLMTVFIGIFTLLNVNITLAQQAATARNFVMFNAGALCAISFLLAAVNEIIQKNDKRRVHWLWWLPAVCALAAVLAAL